MELLGGWWGVAGVGVVALFLIAEVLKYQRGAVTLTARQKVARVLGGAALMGALLMVVFSPSLLQRPDLSRQARNLWELGYWSVALGLGILAFLMAAMDMGEVGRTYARARKDIRARTLTREDVDRLMEAERRDRPDAEGRGHDDDGNGRDARG